MDRHGSESIVVERSGLPPWNVLISFDLYFALDMQEDAARWLANTISI